MQDQQEIYNEARDAILDLFPRIPEEDLNKVSKSAFTKVRSTPAITTTNIEHSSKYHHRVLEKWEPPRGCPWPAELN